MHAFPASLVLILLLSGSPASAGGFDIADQGARAAGRAGAFVARADDLSAIEFNPAGLARMPGTRFYLGNRFSYSNEEYRRAPTYDWSEAVRGIPRYVDFGHVENQAPWQLLGPMLGASTDFGLDDWGFALGVYAPPGVSSQQFPQEGAQRYMLVERDVQILYYTASFAWKYRDMIGLGASLQWVDMQNIKMELIVDGSVSPGLVNPVSSQFDVKARIQGSDHYGFSSILGMWYRPLPYLEVALSGRIIPVNMNAECTLGVAPVHMNLDEPVSLTRDGQAHDDVRFSMTLPTYLRIGVRYIHLQDDQEVFDLELDIGWEAWSLVKEFEMDGDGLIAEVLGQTLDVDRIVLDKRWSDTWSLRLGGDYRIMPGFVTIRAGAFYESPAVPEEYSYVDFFSFHRFGASAGVSVSTLGVDVSLSYTYVFQTPATVSEEESRVFQQVPGSPCQAPYTDPATCDAHYPGMPSAPANAGTYLSSYHFLSVAVSYTF